MALAVSFIVFHKKTINYTLKCDNVSKHILPINVIMGNFNKCCLSFSEQKHKDIELSK
jgi:hypothetical protein